MKVLLAGGGTGGHVFPALALGEELIKQGNNVLFIGDQRTLNYYKNDGPIETKYINLPSPSKRLIKFLFSLLKILPQTYKIIKNFNPDIIIGFGGYPTLPTLLLNNFIFRKPLLLHEANCTLGKINKLFKPFAKVITFGLPPSFDLKSNNNLVFTGNPVRANIKWQEYPSDRSTINILIFAGSQGANLFSAVIPEAIKLVKEVIKNIKISQQCRLEQIVNVTNFYKMHNINADIQPFFDNLPKKMADAHLIICRAGALTISEVNTIDRPAIYIPYPHASQNHQVHNAQLAAMYTNSTLLLEKDLTPIRLSNRILSLIQELNVSSTLTTYNKLSCKDSSMKIIKIIKLILNK